MKRHLLGLMGAAGAVMLWIACAEDPTGAIRGGIARVTPSATYAEVVVGDSSTFSVRAVDEQGNPLPVLPTVTVADANVAAVTVDQASSGNPLPQTNFRVRGVTFGSTTITMTAGGRSAEMTVQTLPQSIEITAPASLRSGETATISAQAVDAAGAPVAGVPITLSVDDETVLAFDDVTLEIEAILAGVAVISATGPAGETGGVPVAEGVAPVTVLAGPPTGAALAAADFGAVGAGGTSTLEVVVTDANGNQNNKVAEIISVMAMSSNNAVATVAAMISDTIIEDIDTGEPVDTIRQVFVEVTGVGAGVVDITGSVETTGGTFDLGSSPATVLNPSVTSLSATAGDVGDVITITGVDMTAMGFDTEVFADGSPISDLFVNSASATAIEFVAPDLGDAGDYEISVAVGGVESMTSSTYTQNSDMDPTEPANDAAGGVMVTLPLDVVGSFEDGDANDFYTFTLAATTSIQIDLDWDVAKDLDILFDDGTNSFSFPCGFAGATGAQPEAQTCEDLPAGDYVLWINDFDQEANGELTPTTYRATITILP